MPISYVLSKSSVLRRIDWQSIKLRNVFWLPGSGEKLVFPWYFPNLQPPWKQQKIDIVSTLPEFKGLLHWFFFGVFSPFPKKTPSKSNPDGISPCFLGGWAACLRIRIRPLSQTNHIGSGSLTLVVSWNIKMAVHSEEDIPNLENHNENTGSLRLNMGEANIWSFWSCPVSQRF